MSVCLKFKILVTTEPIGLYSSEIIPTGPVKVYNFFLGGKDTSRQCSIGIIIKLTMLSGDLNSDFPNHSVVRQQLYYGTSKL